MSDILTDSYQRPLTDSAGHGLGGLLGGLTDLKSQTVHSAADALRQILDKLPIDKPVDTTDEFTFQTHDYHNGNALDHGGAAELDDHKSFRPYDLPNDPTYSSPHSSAVPLPEFRPLPPQSAYPHHSSPVVNSITHTQIITTAYGAPSTGIGGGTSVSAHGSGQPITLMDIETDQWQRQNAVPIGPGVSQADGATADGGSLNLYHVMSLKNHGISEHSGPPTDPHTDPSDSYLPASHESHASGDGSGVVVSEQVVHHLQHHQQQQDLLHHVQHTQHNAPHVHPHVQLQPQDFSDIRKQLLPHYGPPPSPPAAHQQLPHALGPQSIGPSYEIHKSIAYELRGPAQYGQRRLIKVKRPTMLTSRRH